MHYNKLNVTSTSVFCNCKRVHATSASGVVCTNLHSCQVSAPETCVAHQSPCCAVSQVCVFSLRPDYQAHRCLCKTRKRTQPPADGKVIVKPLQQMQRNVRLAQETDTFIQGYVFTLRFLFPLTTDHNGSSIGSASHFHCDFNT